MVKSRTHHPSEGMAHEHHHRNVQGGTARAAVFGISDGLVSNVALVIGVAGGHPAAGVVRLAGIVGLIGGAFSMAAGEYNSMQAQRELLERELEIERKEIHRRPESERRELVQIYRSRGIDKELAEELATEMHRDPALALETHAREELGIDPSELGSPVGAAAASFVTFSVGALLPLIPWFFGGGTGAIWASVVLGLVGSLAIGIALSAFTGRSWVRTSTRQLLVGALAAGVPYLIGNAVGAGISAV
ncbi:MAG TPA: VIT1/CCC1 transporter family protein [Acidimicrobiales bacterium]|jgi:VIT1/CCC1 family predicted Fe2+/Mn2+ transporter|nr:VIT1/CCC1 transporter family protein [Acidimicrobiales bacterium]